MYGILATETSETTETILTTTLSDEAQEFVDNPGLIVSWLQDSVPTVLSFCVQVLVALLVLFVGSKIIKWAVKVIKKAFDKSHMDDAVGHFLSQVIRYLLYFLLIMIILSMFGVATGSVVAVLGSVGVTAGLALQGSLSNFAGGVLILILKPFTIGDYIIESSSGKEGTVTQISVFYTFLKTIDNKVVMIPNGTLSATTITNVSKMPTRRIDLKVGVAYDSDLSLVKEALASVAAGEETILKGEPVDIYVDELADSSINMGLRVWVNTSDYWTTKWRLTENIKRTFDEKGISIPFPQLDVQIKQ